MHGLAFVELKCPTLTSTKFNPHLRARACRNDHTLILTGHQNLLPHRSKPQALTRNENLPGQ